MKVTKKGVANMHDLVHVTCSHCDTNVTFWRDEPDTEVEYIGCYDSGERFTVRWECPVCHVPNKKTINYIKPIYGIHIETMDGIERDRVLTPEEKAEMEEALLIEE